MSPLRPFRWSRTVVATMELGLGVPMARPGDPDAPARPHPFDADVRVTASDEAWVVESDGLPTHKTGAFPNAANPNRILEQSYRFTIPRRPQKAARTPPSFGPIGVAVNGVPFYNPL